MKRFFCKLGFALGGLALLAVSVAVAEGLWNVLIPDITGWNRVGYWQMLGLMVLLRLLCGHFGHFGHFGHRRHPHRMPNVREHGHLHEMMRGMSHDEKRAFIRSRMRNLFETDGRTDGAAAE